MAASFRSALRAAALVCALLVCVAPALTAADTNANCSYNEFLGKWTVKVSAPMPAPTEPSLFCNSSTITVEKTFAIELAHPNVAKVANGPTGNWTLIYNQGIEAWIGEAVLFAFSDFDAAGDDLCARSSSAYFHARDEWRCASVVKLPREDDSEEVQAVRTAALRSPAHVPSDVAAVNAELRAQRVSDPERLSTVFSTDHAFLEKVNAAAGGMFTVKHYPELDGMTIGQLERRRGTTMPVALPHEMQAPAVVDAQASARHHRRAAAAAAASPAVSIPDAFDWRNVSGVNYVSPVRDQGQCGSCYIFSSAGQLEARIRIKSGNTQQPILSTQDAVDCSSYSQGCDGGFPYLLAGKYGFDYGFTEEACNTYKGVDGVCQINSTDSCSNRWKTDSYQYVGGYYGASTMERMQREIMANGPISVGFFVYDEFMHYAGGVYTHQFAADLQLDDYNPFVLVNHAVLMVGWGVTDDDKKTPYWIVKNSWSEKWGEQGFFRILRSSDESMGGECGIQSLSVSASPVLH